MNENKNRNILYTSKKIIYMVMQCIHFFHQLDWSRFDLNKYTSNSSKGCVLGIDLEYPK